MANKTDFSMIWGSNAPDKYEFTPENYMTGWHFVGSVPPSRTMFDSWMRMQDEKSQYLHDIMSDAFGTTSPGGIAIDDTKVPTSDKNNLITLLSNLANVEKGIIGDTSWRDNPAITLAAMSAFVQQLAAGSDVEWSGNTWKNKKLGITGLSKQNGYISLGPNFGGLIIQWVTGVIPASYELYGVAYPLTFNTYYAAVEAHSTWWKSDFKRVSINSASTTTSQLVLQEENKLEAGFKAIIVGK